MNKSVFAKIVSAAVISLGAIAVSLPAQAGTLTPGGWEYARDDWNYDGSGNASGAAQFSATSRYDFYAMGFKRVGNELLVTINTSYKAGASGTINNVGYGDLFLDFNYGKPNNSFSAAQGSLVGIRFAPNDGNANSANNGVYTGVTGKSIAGTNQGYTNLKQYNDKVKADADNAGSNSRFGDLLWTDPYFAAYTPNNKSIPNVIDANVNGGGTKYTGGNVRSLSPEELATAVFPTNAFSNNTNNKKFGFAFTLPEELRGNAFLATLGFECSNDTISGSVRAVPVPPAIAGIIAAGAFGGWRAARRKKQLKAVEA